MTLATKKRRKPPAAPPPESFQESYEAEGKQVANTMAIEQEREPVPNWEKGTRILCREHHTYGVVTDRLDYLVAIRWEHNDQEAVYYAEDIKRFRMHQARPAKKPAPPVVAEWADEKSELIATASKLWGEIDKALEVVSQAEYSALDSARLLGQTLMDLKAKTLHGYWEQTREEITHPTTGKPLPSSTATLYQRIAFNWESLSQAGVTSVRAAAEHLKRIKSATVAEIEGEKNNDANSPTGEKGSSGSFTDSPAAAQRPEPGAGDHALGQGQNQNPQKVDLPSVEGGGETDIPPAGPASALVPQVCKPEIAPVDFNQQMAESTTRFGGCHSCRNRILTDSGDRYWCSEGIFDDTLPLSFNWQHREGCQQFGQTHAPAPSAPAPEPKNPKVRIKVSGKGAIADRLAAHVEMVIVEIGGQSYVIQPENLQLEKM